MPPSSPQGEVVQYWSTPALRFEFGARIRDFDLAVTLLDQLQTVSPQQTYTNVEKGQPLWHFGDEGTITPQSRYCNSTRTAPPAESPSRGKLLTQSTQLLNRLTLQPRDLRCARHRLENYVTSTLASAPYLN